MTTQTELAQHLTKANELLVRATDEATTELARALEAGPGDLTVRQQLAELLARAGRPHAAIDQLQHVAGRYAAEGKLLKAIAISRVIVALNPRHTSTQEVLAELYSKQVLDEPRVASLPASMAGALGSHTSSTFPLDMRCGALFVAARADPEAPEASLLDASDSVPLEDGPFEAPLFSMLERDAFLALIERLQLRWTRKGEVIVEAGDSGDSMFIVVQGAVNVYRGPASERGELIAVLGEESYFGEKALVGDAARRATVVAAQDGLLFSLSRSALGHLESEFPGTRQVVERLFRERLLANLLAVSPIFSAFPAEQKQALAGRFWIRDLQPGTALLEQGQQGAGFFVLLHGSCEVFHTTHDGQRHAYPAMTPGDVFGEISLLFDSQCTATVKSATWCEVLELPRKDFHELLLPNAKVRELIEGLAQERLDRTADLKMATGDVGADPQSSWIV